MKQISIIILLLSMIFSCKSRSNRKPIYEKSDFKVINEESDFLDQNENLPQNNEINESQLTEEKCAQLKSDIDSLKAIIKSNISKNNDRFTEEQITQAEEFLITPNQVIRDLILSGYLQSIKEEADKKKLEESNKEENTDSHEGHDKENDHEHNKDKHAQNSEMISGMFKFDMNFYAGMLVLGAGSYELLGIYHLMEEQKQNFYTETLKGDKIETTRNIKSIGGVVVFGVIGLIFLDSILQHFYHILHGPSDEDWQALGRDFFIAAGLSVVIGAASYWYSVKIEKNMKTLNKTQANNTTNLKSDEKAVQLRKEFENWRAVQEFKAKDIQKNKIYWEAKYNERMKKSMDSYRGTGRIEAGVAIAQIIMGTMFYSFGGAFGLEKENHISYLEGTDDIMTRLLQARPIDPETPLGSDVCNEMTD